MDSYRIEDTAPKNISSFQWLVPPGSFLEVLPEKHQHAPLMQTNHPSEPAGNPIISPFSDAEGHGFQKQRKNSPLVWITLGVGLAILLSVASFFILRQLNDPFRTLEPFPVSKYMENYKSLAGSKFKANLRVENDLGWKEGVGGYSPVTNASTVRSGTVAHENQGNVAANFNSSPKQGGHSALFKAKQDANDIYNAAKEIEDLYSSTDETDLKAQDNSAVGLVDNYLAVAGQDPLTGNIDSWVVSDFNCSTSAKSYNRLNN